MNENQLFILLQVNDARWFPIGGYSHSYGLETYIQKRILLIIGETALAFMKNSIKIASYTLDLASCSSCL